jgi:hypothetical protein
VHRVLLRTVVFDFPPEVHDAGRDFWAVALGAAARRGERYLEYHVLEHPAALGPVMVQRLGQGPGRVHVDIETDDTEAEVARLLAAGAVVVEKVDDWTVLSDPGGVLFCVVPADPEGFAESAAVVGE